MTLVVANLIDQFFLPPPREARQTVFCRRKWIFKRRKQFSEVEIRVGKRAKRFSGVENEFSVEENSFPRLKIELRVPPNTFPGLKIDFQSKKTFFWGGKRT